MVYNRRELKVVSIIQLVMTAIFLILGLVDRFKVRYLYTSFMLSPCWTAGTVLPAGIMGLVLSTMSIRPSTLIYALKSVSVACVAMSGATMYHYQWGIGIMLSQKVHSNLFIVKRESKFEFTDQENAMLAISSLAILFSIIEMILAFAFTKNCGDTGYEPRPQDNQGVYAYRQLGTGQFQLQPLPPTYIAAQPMVAGQSMVVGQSMVAGQQMVTGQQTVAAQRLVAFPVSGQ